MSAPPKRRRLGRSTLFVVICLFVGSGLVRLSDGTGLAVAREVEALARSELKKEAHTPLTCAPDQDVAAVLAALQDRERHVAEAEAKQADTARALELARAEIATQLAALEQAEAELKKTLSTAETAAEDDLSKLTAVYENMKPKDAAALFEAMAPEFAAGFLGRMRPHAAAQVMTGLPPEAAYTISVILAGRNADVPKE